MRPSISRVTLVALDVRLCLAAAIASLVALIATPASAQPAKRAAPASAYAEALIKLARTHQLSKAEAWLRLGHYRDSWFGGPTSEIDGSGFFLATAGKADPDAELAATLRAFFAPPSVGPTPKTPAEQARAEHAICRFPARFLWLNEQLHFERSQLPRVVCRGFGEFITSLEPESVTLVFSSYYLNNPSSAFGHTFLRVNKAGARDAEHNDLLDYGVDYSANVDTANPLLYAFKGLVGLFPGVFRKVPYYLKVREYNDYESRDLWEYELDLRPEEVRMFVAHLWELGSTFFQYFYLSENCSYQVLGALEAASPRLHLLNHLSWPVLPADTIKALRKNPGLVKSVQYRPSAETVFQRRVSGLSDHEVDALSALVRDPRAALPRNFSVRQRVLVLDAALDLADSRFASELAKLDAERDIPIAEYKQTLLERRAAEAIPSDPPDYPLPEGRLPHRAHGSRRVGMGAGFSSGTGYYQTLKTRLALHDLGDTSLGFPDSAQIEFLPMTLRYEVEAPKLKLEDIALVTLLSVAPWSRFRMPLAWSASFGATRLRDRGCDDCLALQAQVGGGGAITLFDGALLGYFLLDTQILGLAPIDGIAQLPLRAGIGPVAGLRLRLLDSLVATAQWGSHYLPAQEPYHTWSGDASLRWSYRFDFALGLEGRMQPLASSLQAMSYLYF